MFYKLGLEVFIGSIATLAADRFQAAHTFTKREIPLAVPSYLPQLCPLDSWSCPGYKPSRSMHRRDSHRSPNQTLADTDSSRERYLHVCIDGHHSADRRRFDRSALSFAVLFRLIFPFSPIPILVILRLYYVQVGRGSMRTMPHPTTDLGPLMWSVEMLYRGCGALNDL
jgi:hypothetical protein